MTIEDTILWFLNNILFINFLLAILIVFFERRNPSSTWAWLMILFFVPILGFLLYLFIGQDLRKKKVFAIKEEEDQLHRMVHRQEKALHQKEIAYDYPNIQKCKDIIHLHLVGHNALYSQDNSVDIFYNGYDKFKNMIEDIEEAKDFIHIEYYIIRNDSLGKKVVELLARKAREGVEVKLLYDGMGCIWLPKDFFKPLLEAGGEISCFLPPFLPYINLRVNYRNHRKICIIDGQIAYVGGINIGTEYLGLSKKMGFWRDTHLRIQGSAVDNLELRFLQDWRFSTKTPHIIEQKYFPPKHVDGNTGIQIVSSGPDSKWSSIRNGFLKMISLSKKRIYIHTPYFIPDDSLLEALKIAALSGVDVRIIIPNKPDHMFVYWASLSYVGELLQAGVRCYTYEKGFMHSKMILVDDLVSTVGTANFDIRSFKLNFEVNAFIYDEEVNSKLCDQFLRDLEESEEITAEIYKQRGFLIKFKESVSRLLSPML
ncbi:cardiolipin synthase [Defluviitalea saccharophila]|uniref:Cardiolipin synthase n=1 Tax=Defluviitalea saccharophila TaxID=879970 RepID=A0ABZ2Y4P5_9FIRM|nr:cardiolipin synthase [Candidatus Epulonipiscium sp.]